MKIIMLSGHGMWDPSGKHEPQRKLLGMEPFVSLPGKCTMHFYTSNFTLLNDASGRQLEQGKFGGVKPEQTAGPYKSVPNMMLIWPYELNLAMPPKGWRRVSYSAEKGTKIPVDDKNIQFVIEKPTKGPHYTKRPINPYGRLYLERIFRELRPAIQHADSVLFIWAACREVGLNKTKEKTTKRPFKPIRSALILSDYYKVLDPDIAEHAFERWDKLDGAITPRVKVWANHRMPMNRATFMAQLGVKKKLAKIRSKPEQAKAELAWEAVWTTIERRFLFDPLQQTMEGLKLDKRKDKLTFGK